MFTRQLLLVLASGLLVPDAAQPGSPRIGVTARLYNTAQVPAEITGAALAVATRALAAGGVDISWRNCDSKEACAQVPLPNELVIQLVRSRGATHAAPLVLGEALIDTGAGTGVLATIYVDRVERVAALADTHTVLLLGRAVAHELGHLLLATNAHSTHGLMRARWTPGDIRRNEMVDWQLSRKDAEEIRKRLR